MKLLTLKFILIFIYLISSSSSYAIQQPNLKNLIIHKDPKKHAHEIHDIQTQWQLLDLSSKPASKSQWVKFNELTNKAWEPCKEYFDEITFDTLDIMDNGIADNTELFNVPEGYFFVMGDNRDNSQDSRFKTVGFIPMNNLVGKARFIFFSLENSRFLEIWKWPKAIRGSRIFSTIK